MNSSRSSSSLRTRRNLLGAIAGAVPAAALLASPSAAGAAPAPAAETPADDLFSLARLRSYKSRRSSSWDRTGGNADSVPVEPGASATLLDVAGPGVVTHIWFTINSDDPMHLKNLVLRAWWDGETSPSVEAPIGDFYGLGLGEYFNYQSALLTVAPAKALNSYFEMPFATAARITLTNEGPKRTDNLYFAVDYVTLASLPEGLGRFHAQFRQAAPCHGWTNNWTHNWEDPVGDKKNLDGADNYVFLEATGRGHFVGVTQSVLQNQNDWFGEGDDMMFIDGDKMPTINGTGTEDYYNGAWDFYGQQFDYPHNGAPLITGGERIGSRYSLYRWHLESPIAFEQSIRVTIEHGHANHRSDNFYSVAYWYQTEPHAAFPALPAVADRVPRLMDVGGGAGAAPVKATEE
jgi:hypothetical protein